MEREGTISMEGSSGLAAGGQSLRTAEGGRVGKEREKGKHTAGSMDRRGTARRPGQRMLLPAAARFLGPSRFSRVRSVLGKVNFFVVRSRGLTSSRSRPTLHVTLSSRDFSPVPFAFSDALVFTPQNVTLLVSGTFDFSQPPSPCPLSLSLLLCLPDPQPRFVFLFPRHVPPAP